MKKFVLRFTKFIALISFLLLLIGGFNWYVINQNQYKPDGQTLIVGDSHVMCGINPKILGNASNVAQYKEIYFESYFKLKKLLEKQQGLKTVILGCTPHNFSAFNDKKLVKEGTATVHFERYYAMVNYQDWQEIDHNIKKKRLTYFKKIFLLPSLKHQAHIGHFDKRKPGLGKSKLNKIVKRHFIDDDEKEHGVSKISDLYLEKIVDLCKSKGIRLVLLATPVHQEYYSAIPDHIRKEYQRQKEKYASHENVKILDFQQREYPDEMFTDHDHLASQGAKDFTRFLSTLLVE